MGQGDAGTIYVTSGTSLGATAQIVASSQNGKKVRVFDVIARYTDTPTALSLRSDSTSGSEYIYLHGFEHTATYTSGEGVVFPNGVFIVTGSNFAWAAISCLTEL